MARIDYIEAALQNWARWKIGQGRAGGPGGYAAVKLGEAPLPRSSWTPWSGPAIPVLAVEASEMDQAIQGLPSELRVTVVDHYLARDGEADQCRRLCCSRATLHARIDRAHRLLAEHWAARQERRRVMRERLIEQQAAARKVRLSE